MKVTNLNWHNLNINKQNLKYFPLVFLLVFVIVFSSCDKDEADYTADFSYEYIDESRVRIINESEGEYWSMIWNFGNGEVDTTYDKKKTYEIQYLQSGNYNVSLRLTNYTGDSKSTDRTVSIEITGLTLSFTAEISPTNPNEVMLKNTTIGSYDSFEWKYRDLTVENEMEHLAYFPYAGDYVVELLVYIGSEENSYEEIVNIAQDDPNYIPGLIWSDEFDYTGLPDPAKWNMETGGGGWGNNELQYYTDSINNASVDNGILTITAREEQYGGNDYTSARINTQNKFDFKYGRIEARIKLPFGQGLWPAFWMLGANYSSVGWPSCGEIDIMELVGGTVSGGDNTVHATLHWDNNGAHADYGESYSLPSGIFADDFHIFSVEWDDQEIKAFVDDTQYFVIDITDAGLSEFHNDFFVILNLAVGGNWPGPPNASTTFPQTMEVDYVRVFQDEE